MPPATKRTPQDSIDLAVLANDVAHTKDDVADIKAVLGTMSESLQGIARLEERQVGVVASLERGEKAFADHEKRVSAIEAKIPQLEEMRSWVIKGVSVGVTALVLGVASIVFNSALDHFMPKTPQPVYLIPSTSAQVK